MRRAGSGPEAGRKRTGSRPEAAHLGREAEELQEAQVVPRGEQRPLPGERGGVHQAERPPDGLNAGAQDRAAYLRKRKSEEEEE
ncbi:hypothetical protein EYF80_059243 [Liparis tanakae]|uniref:Uncharacterized protein n=1 Tax=Liparis tanakae TaxID=230148 RepID=A0A4Z2EQF6_9TELE|nr:hypothetical protein EYF80_059243 [Liparis tanakae]